jgi:hypothetical protein
VKEASRLLRLKEEGIDLRLADTRHGVKHVIIDLTASLPMSEPRGWTTCDGRRTQSLPGYPDGKAVVAW